MIKSVCDFLKSVFNYADTVKEKQSETEIIKDKRDYKKATDIAERIFEVTDKYHSEIGRLRRLFQKYN